MPDEPRVSAEPVEAETSESVGRPTDVEHDRELVRESLALTPEERLAVLQDFVDTFWTPQHG